MADKRILSGRLYASDRPLLLRNDFINIWPCYIGVIIYYCYKKKDFREHLHIAMFSMAFGPLVSEMLFRYTLGSAYVQGEVHITPAGILLTLAVGLAAGLALPGMLEGALWCTKVTTFITEVLHLAS